MKFFLLLLLCSQVVWAHEKTFRTKADAFATASFTEQKHHPWPFPLLSIGHNMQSYQDYSGSPYWHDGLDVRGNQDQSVYSTAAGVVVNIQNYVLGNPNYWEIAILDDEGFVWKYHHISKSTISKEIQNSYKTHEKLPQGTLIGNIVRWSVVTYGETYHHLHLLVVGKDQQYINPFLMMEPLPDTQVPIINEIGLAKNHKPILGNKVAGEYALFLDASDLTLHTKFILPPYKISYVLDGSADKLVWEFIHLPGGTSDEKFISDFYMKGTCGDYECRKFYFNLNFSPETPRASMNAGRGDHDITVTVEDIVGNKASKSFHWTVTE